MPACLGAGSTAPVPPQSHPSEPSLQSNYLIKTERLLDFNNKIQEITRKCKPDFRSGLS
jgi:hypothetical protein